MPYLQGLGRQFYLLALMDLFGLIQVRHAPVPPRPWAPAGFSRTPFGDAVFTLLADQHYRSMLPRHDESGDEEPEDAGRLINPPDQTTGLGDWQPLFQPDVPAWQHTLAAPPSPAKTGVFVFRVSVDSDGSRRKCASVTISAGDSTRR